MWYVVLTRPGQEQRAALNLAQQGGQVFLPMLDVEKVKRGKRQLCSEPLFPGYLFLDCTADNPLLSRVRSTYGAQGLLRFGSELASLDEQIIADLRKRCESPQPLAGFMQGDLLRMKDGPLKDYQAIFQRYDGTERAVVLIGLLGKQNELKVALASLDKD